MKVLPEGSFPPETTPEERFDLLGRKLFEASPEDLRRRQAEHEQRQAEAGPRKAGRKRSGPQDAPGGR